MRNDERSKAAAQAIEAYRLAGEYKDAVPAELLGDLLGDLRHWATRLGVDFEQCTKNAKACYEEEKREETV